MERYLASLYDLLERMDLDDVHFTGHIEFSSLVSCFKLADVYLSMSEHEGFGVPLLESFYLKKPVLAYAAGAVEETMNNGGILLRSKDYIRTAAVIHRLAKDSGFHSRIIESQNQALEKYKTHNVRRILLDHLERFIQK